MKAGKGHAETVLWVQLLAAPFAPVCAVYFSKRF